jgi:hypothetical protein
MAAGPISAGQGWTALIWLLIVMAVVEINALVGPATPDRASAGKKLLATVNGTFWAGFVLTAIIVIVLKFII